MSYFVMAIDVIVETLGGCCVEVTDMKVSSLLYRDRTAMWRPTGYSMVALSSSSKHMQSRMPSVMQPNAWWKESLGSSDFDIFKWKDEFSNLSCG